MAKKFEFDESIYKRLVALGGSCSESADTFVDLVRSVQLPTLQEFFTVLESISLESISEIQEIYKSENTENQKLLKNTLNEKTKSFTVFKNDVLHEPLDLVGDGLIDKAIIPELEEFIWGESLIMYQFGYWDGLLNDCFYFCVSDPNPANPYVYATDHASSFQCISLDHSLPHDYSVSPDDQSIKSMNVSYEGTFEEFLNQFLTPAEINKNLVDRILAEI